MAFRIETFRKRAKRALVAHPKFYLFDAGVFRTLRPAGPLDHPAEIDGQALEGLVAQHLRAWIDYRGKKNALHFWRTRAGSEVDFVVYGEDGLWAIEVKNTGRDRPEDLRGLKAFLDEYPTARTVFLHRGEARALVGKKILVMPCEVFLRGLAPGKSLEEAVEGAAHVRRHAAEKEPDRGRKRQHERTASTRTARIRSGAHARSKRKRRPDRVTASRPQNSAASLATPVGPTRWGSPYGYRILGRVLSAFRPLWASAPAS